MTANSLSKALERARDNNRRVLLIFCTDWCGYCKKLKRDILPIPGSGPRWADMS